jgi:RimJ/RimL family protein N-acetyltransferase
VAGNLVSWMQSGRRLFGYWIGQDFWGRGIATRALAECLPQVTQRPLFAYVARHNVGSIRVLEKCDFELAGKAARLRTKATSRRSS